MNKSVIWVAMLGCLALVSWLPSQAQDGMPVTMQTYRNKDLGIEFQFPGDYEVQPNLTLGGLPSLALYPKSSLGPDERPAPNRTEAPIRIAVLSGLTFDHAAQQAGFEKQGGRWVIRGRQGLAESATKINYNGWRGLRGMAEVGVSDPRTGKYAGLGEELRAVLYKDSKQAAIIETSPSVSESVFNEIVASFKLSGEEKRQKPKT